MVPQDRKEEPEYKPLKKKESGQKRLNIKVKKLTSTPIEEETPMSAQHLENQQVIDIAATPEDQTPQPNVKVPDSACLVNKTP